MSFLGKIIIVVQVVLSFLFMAFAGAVFTVQTNWRNEAQRLQTRIGDDQDSFDAERTRLNDNITNLTKRAEDAENAAMRFQATANNLQSQLTQEQEEHRKTRDALAAVEQLAQNAAVEAEERREESQKIRDENIRQISVIDEQAKRLREKDDVIYTLELQDKARNRKHVEVLRENQNLLDYITSIGRRYDPSLIEAGKTLPPEVTGVVVGLRKDRRGRVELVEISLGSDDGLSRGHELSVYSTEGNGKYLGEIRLVYITADRAVGAVVEPAKNGIIQKGDNVTTKL